MHIDPTQMGLFNVKGSKKILVIWEWHMGTLSEVNISLDVFSHNKGNINIQTTNDWNLQLDVKVWLCSPHPLGWSPYFELVATCRNILEIQFI